MHILVALLPLILWVSLFILSIIKHKFNKIIFIICFSFSFVLNIVPASWDNISMELFRILFTCAGQTMMLYVIVDFINNLINRRRKIGKID